MNSSLVKIANKGWYAIKPNNLTHIFALALEKLHKNH